MIYQSLETGGHTWEKQNLVTITSGKKPYDIFRCKCGARGKSYELGMINIDGRTGRKKAKLCPIKSQRSPKGRVRITVCTAVGPAFSNLTPGSVHELIEPPNDRSDRSEYWVMGIGEPVRILPGEFEAI